MACIKSFRLLLMALSIEQHNGVFMTLYVFHNSVTLSDTKVQMNKCLYVYNFMVTQAKQHKNWFEYFIGILSHTGKNHQNVSAHQHRDIFQVTTVDRKNDTMTRRVKQWPRSVLSVVSSWSRNMQIVTAGTKHSVVIIT